MDKNSFFWKIVEGKLPPPPCAKTLGLEFLQIDGERGTVEVKFEAKPEFLNPAGNVQGGFLAAMLDDTMGPAVFMMTEGKLYTTTVSLTVNFLAPARPGRITAEAKVTQLGKTIAFVEGKLTAEDGTLLATASVSARLLEAAKVMR